MTRASSGLQPAKMSLRNWRPTARRLPGRDSHPYLWLHLMHLTIGGARFGMRELPMVEVRRSRGTVGEVVLLAEVVATAEPRRRITLRWWLPSHTHIMYRRISRQCSMSQAGLQRNTMRQICNRIRHTDMFLPTQPVTTCAFCLIRAALASRVAAQHTIFPPCIRMDRGQYVLEPCAIGL